MYTELCSTASTCMQYIGTFIDMFSNISCKLWRYLQHIHIPSLALISLFKPTERFLTFSSSRCFLLSAAIIFWKSSSCVFENQINDYEWHIHFQCYFSERSKSLHKLKHIIYFHAENIKETDTLTVWTKIRMCIWKHPFMVLH